MSHSASRPSLRVPLRVEVLEDRSLLAVAVLPNDPRFLEQYALNNTGQKGGRVDADIDAPEAWAVGTGSLSTVAAIIDSGIDYRHADLFKNIWINQGEIPSAVRTRLTDLDGDGRISFWDLADSRNQGAGKITDLNRNGRIDGGDLLFSTTAGGWANGTSDDGDAFVDDLIGWDFANNDNNPIDDNDHGTHTAGIIGAVGNNGVGIAGVNWRVSLMALKFLSSTGFGTTDAARRALDYAVAKGAVVSNHSWGGDVFNQDLANAIERARLAGHIVVTAAGNGGGDYKGDNLDLFPSYPASYSMANVLTVAGTTGNDAIMVASNYGPATVELGAPGLYVFSTTRNDGYRLMTGTSMATAHTTGVIALVRSAHPDWAYHRVIDQVLRTTDRIPALAGKTVSGGRLNAYRALTEQPPDVTAPRIVSVTPNASGAGAVERVRVLFDEAVNPGSFTIADVKVSGPGGSVAVLRVDPVVGGDDQAFDVSFARQSGAGTYRVEVGPGVRDLAGNAMSAAHVSSFVIEPTFVFTSSPSLVIRDMAVTVARLTIDRNITIGDLNVRVDINHTFDNDLYIHLVGPDGTDVPLANRRGGTADNYRNTVFDDDAGLHIRDGLAPFTGNFRPEGRLSSFDGKNARGTWQLVIEDRQRIDSGRLNSWSLVIENRSGGVTMAALPEERGPDQPPADEVEAPTRPHRSVSAEAEPDESWALLPSRREEGRPAQTTRERASAPGTFETAATSLQAAAVDTFFALTGRARQQAVGLWSAAAMAVSFEALQDDPSL